MKPRYWVFLWLALLTAIRLAYIPHSELVPDEAYYHMWAQHPDISYYSKGPGVAAAIWLGTAIFGDTAFGIRVLSPFLALGTALLLYSLARRLYDENIAVWTVFTTSMIPILNAGGLIMTIDPLSIFFWAAALVTFWRALERCPQFSLWWPATGALMGLGFLCKYTNVAQYISIILLLAFTRRLRREFRAPGFWTMTFVFLLSTIPPIVWNARHEWITLAHLQTRGGLDTVKAFRVTELLEFIGVHFAVYSPLIFIGMAMALWWGWQRSRGDFTVRFLVIFSLPLILFYCLLSLRDAGEANWTAPAFVSLIVLSVAMWSPRADKSRPVRFAAIAALALGGLTTLVMVNTDIVRHLGFQWAYDRDPSDRMRGWKTTAEQVQAIRDRLERETGERYFLIANKYQTAAELGHYLPDKRLEGPGHPPVYIPESPVIQNQFSFWPRYELFLEKGKAVTPQDAYFTEESGINPFVGRDALFITDSSGKRPPSTVKNGFRDYELVAILEIHRHGLHLRTLRVFACYDYQTLPL